MNYFSKNIKLLRENLHLKQDEMQAGTGIKGATWSNYELGKTEPSIDVILSISKFFRIELADLIEKDLSQKGNLIENKDVSKNQEKGNLISNRIGNLIAQKEDNQHELKISIVAEPGEEHNKKATLIPITDISVAAGTGHYNNSYIEHLDSLRLPVNLTKKGGTYLAVKIKGHSMAPTLQDSSFVIIRLLDRSEWHKMPDERIYVISDTEGKTYLKRVKNRFKQDFIVLMSDNPDKASFPNFNLVANEINTIWYVEWYLSAKMPNIHDQFYPRLQRLEEKVDQLLRNNPKM